MINKFLRFFTAPIFKDNEEKTRSASLLNVIVLSSFLAVLFYLPFAPKVRVPYIVPAIAVIFTVWVAMRRGFVRFASIAMVVGISTVFVTSIYTNGGVQAPEFGGLAIVILLAGLLLGWKAATGMMILSILYGMILLKADSLGWLPESTVYSETYYWMMDSIFFVMAGVILTLSLKLVYDAFQRVNMELEERKRAEQEIQSRSRQLAALLEASQSLTESLNLGEVLQKITDKSANIMAVDRTAIYLADGEHLYFGASTPLLPPELPETLRRARLADHPHIVQALTTGQPIILADAAFTALTDAEQMIVDALGLRTIVYIPLAAKKQAEGVLVLGTVGKPKEFSKNEVDLARTFSNQAALAIANARLYGGLSIYVEELENQIRERKQAEQALRASEERFRLLFENNHTVMMLIEPVSGAIRDANMAAAEFYGYSLSELRGMNINEINQLTPEEVYAERMRALKQERNFFHFQHRRSSGEIRSVEVHSAPMEVDGNTLLFSIVYDVTDRKRAEEQIQRQLKYLSALRTIDTAITSSFDLRSILDIVLQQALSQLGVDASAVLLFNAEMEMIEYAARRGFHSDALHYTKLRLGEGYAGRAVLERKIIHIPNLPKTGSKLARVLQLEHESFVDYYAAPLLVKGEVKGVLEIYHRSPLSADSQWLEFLETLAGQAAIAIDNALLWEQVQQHARDLEMRVAERTAELNRTNAELEHANRAKDEFLANMSHELRTPLNSILGLSESLLEQRRESLTEHQQKSLQIIASSGYHLLELITDVLDLSKIEAGKFDHYPQIVDVDALCKSSLSFVHSQAVKKAITVTYTNEASLSSIVADPRRLKQILVNLLTNAVKFTAEGGRVILRVHADAEQDLVELSVMDTGIGIALQDLKRLFQPFVQVDSKLNRQFEGTGLGLALVQKLTDLHGGSVEVESEVGVGSRFTIKLPWKQDREISQGIIESDGERPAAGGSEQRFLSLAEPVERGTILLVEDNMANILTIGEYLESHGFKIVKAHDGLEAIEKAEASDPSIILMDIQMPVMDGLEATRRLRATSRFATTPIIAVTALAMPGDRERCLEAGANEYMSKPVSLKMLMKTILKLTAPQ